MNPSTTMYVRGTAQLNPRLISELSEFISPTTAMTAEVPPLNVMQTWTRSMSLHLISAYRDNFRKVGKTIRSQKELFKLLSEDLNGTFGTNYSTEQVNNKWKTLERAYKKKKDNDSLTGRGAKKFEFEEEMDSVFEKSRRINPEILVSEDEVVLQSHSPSPRPHASSEAVRMQEEEEDLPGSNEENDSCITPVTRRRRRRAPTRTEVLENIRQDRLKYYERKMQMLTEKMSERKRRNDLVEERNRLLKDYLASKQ